MLFELLSATHILMKQVTLIVVTGYWEVTTNFDL